MAGNTPRRRTSAERASAHLDSAVARLEAAVTARLAPGGPGGNGAGAADVEAVRAENATLKDVNATVSRRLDDAIGRIRSVLGG